MALSNSITWGAAGQGMAVMSDDMQVGTPSNFSAAQSRLSGFRLCAHRRLLCAVVLCC